MRELHQKPPTRSKSWRYRVRNQNGRNRTKFSLLIAVLLVFGLSTTSMSNEWANYYFPDALDSFWVYEDQDGEELTRYAIEPEEMDGETYRAFSYSPRLEDWAEYEYSVRPYFYQVSDEWIAFSVGREVENALKAATTKQLEEGIAVMREAMSSQGLPDGVSIDFDYDIQVGAQDYFYFLPTPATFNEEWQAMQLNLTITMTIEIQGLPFEVPEANQTVKTYLTVVETGNVVSTEAVDTVAGTFEDCLKIEFQTETSTDIELPPELQAQGSALLGEQQTDESLTTLWLAPNVGIVKWMHEHEQSDEERSLELIQYEINSTESESN